MPRLRLPVMEARQISYRIPLFSAIKYSIIAKENLIVLEVRLKLKKGDRLMAIIYLNDKNKVENIIKAQKQNIDKNACSKICEFIIDEIRKYSK